MTTLIEKPFTDQNILNLRLNNVVCKYKGKLGLLSTAAPYGHVGLKLDQVFVVPYYMYSYEIAANDPNRSLITYVNNEDLNIFDLNLGYSVIDGYLAYIGRLPARTTQVGLSRENISDVSNKLTRNIIIQYMYKKPMIDMFEGKYTEPEIAWSQVRSSPRTARAISKEVAFGAIESGVYGLYCRGNLLGITTSLSPNFSLLSSKKKLARIFEEDLEGKGIQLN